MKKTLKNIESYPYHVIGFVTVFVIVSIFVSASFLKTQEVSADAWAVCWDNCSGGYLPFHPEDYSSFPCGCVPPFST